jgi:GTP-binding protein Era
MADDDDSVPRAGRVAIVGRPNAGKSTLLNALLGQRLAIITPKPGTTRTCLLGVYVDGATQIAFVDTPGLERPRSIVGRVLVEEAQGSLEGADAALVVVDATRRGPGDDPIPPADAEVLDVVKAAGRPFVLVLNKVDRVKRKESLLPLLEAWQTRFEPAGLVPISALRRKGLRGVVKELRALLPEGILYEDQDFVTDRPERFFVAELVREALIRNTHDEVPYALAVRIEEFSDEGSLVRIGATIVVDRDSHKGIVIGAGGKRLKQVGSEARPPIEELLGKKVFLRLFVKVDASWTQNPQKVRQLLEEPGGEL